MNQPTTLTKQKEIGFWQEQWVKLLFGTIATMIGFFFALFFNSLLEKQKEKELFQTMLKIVNYEANNNLQILLTTYPFIFKDPKHLLYPEINYSASEQYLKDQNFLTYASPELCKSISYSNMHLSYLFKFKLTSEKLKLDSTMYNIYSKNFNENFRTELYSSIKRLKVVDSLSKSY